MELVKTLWNKATGIADRLSWLGPLLVRIAIGTMFAVTGWGKLQNIQHVIDWFANDLKLPAAAFQAHLVAYTEFLGGICIVIGLGTRFFAVPLAVTMVVALVTGGAFDEKPEGILDVLRQEETIYLTVLIWLALVGAGKASIDRFVAARITRK